MGMSIALTLLLACVSAGADVVMDSLPGLPEVLPTEPDASLLDFPTIYPPTTDPYETFPACKGNCQRNKAADKDFDNRRKKNKFSECVRVCKIKCLDPTPTPTEDAGEVIGPTEILDELVDNLMLSEPITFIDGLYPVVRNIGKPVTLVCNVRGPPPLNLYIVHDRIATFLARNQKRFLQVDTIYDPAVPDRLGVVHTISAVEERDGGVYRCQAESIDGQVAVSTATLTVVDPCEGVTCGYEEQCVNVNGNGICTCNFECPMEAQEPVCVGQVTYSSLCHFGRVECRRGSPSNVELVPGVCPGQAELELPTEVSCSISGEGHVSKFNGDYFSFRGNCPYYMISDTRGGKLIVYARTERCNSDKSGMCLQSVTIYVDRVFGFSIERGFLVNDNGKSRSPANNEKLLLGGGVVSVTRRGKTIVGTIENKNIKFFYDGLNYFKITIPIEYVDSESDLGGFCGGIPLDYIPLDGRDISFVESISLTALGDEEVCKPEFGAPVCMDPNIAASVASAFEDNEQIAECAAVIPMERYIERAIQDTCSCSAESLQTNSCFCNMLYAYVEDCFQAGVEISFEGELCPISYHKDVFKLEGVDYRRYRKRWYNKKNI